MGGRYLGEMKLLDEFRVCVVKDVFGMIWLCYFSSDIWICLFVCKLLLIGLVCICVWLYCWVWVSCMICLM